jgi:hypothetical protein
MDGFRVATFSIPLFSMEIPLFMESLDLLIRGLAALGVTGVIAVLARARFRKSDDGAPADIGLD